MTETLELEPDAFWRMVTQEKLQVDGPSAGYMWTGKQGRDGWEVFKVRAQPIGWLYQARRVNTQSAGGGGALTTRISVASGQTAKLISYSVTGPASNTTLAVGILDEDGATHLLIANNGAAANSTTRLPSIGSAATASGNIADTQGYIMGPGQLISCTSAAALQTETQTVAVTLLLSTPTMPTWDTTGSAGTPSLAASTISTANTLQAVYL